MRLDFCNLIENPSPIVNLIKNPTPIVVGVRNCKTKLFEKLVRKDDKIKVNYGCGSDGICRWMKVATMVEEQRY